MKVRLLCFLAAVGMLSLVSPALGERGPVVDLASLPYGLKIALGQKIVLAFDVQGDKLITRTK